ncbi:Bifunctional inhibitor/plant lipid transfer protein/seed storage helical domain [Macleaya cordata]|uniref:Bifunctional inhibitor/plant lipid transfer protein/seed storage helical domain n=1 Tax=Macleaya cordata TaxID=56857 RepID=A0A200QTQ9_MACCD|nr:Bifunctional inhibitor/plant lipid transfer protein/seed storage helical domain [Macleaya cordata]
MMKTSAASCYFVLFLALVLVLNEARVSTAAASVCNVTALKPCFDVISNPKSTQARLCCSTLKKQQKCICQYVKDPKIKTIVNPKVAKDLAKKCGITLPICKN